jgi:GNAT superfamily N-acetyltransferase
MNPGVSVRRAKEEDADAMALLNDELGYAADAEVMRKRILAILASSADLLIVAVDASATMAGWLQAHSAHIIESGFRVEIVGLIVSSKFRRRGVGRALVLAAEEWAETVSAKAVVVRSNANRLESHVFYRALGYSPIKTQRVYRKSLASVSK